MIKKNSDSRLNVFIENKQIKQVSECKTLGVIVDQHLSWKSNSENICKKITAGISAIRRVKPLVDKDTLISIYNAIVRPYFDYCCEVWDVFGESQSKRLQKLQNRAARIILNMSNDVNHSIALRALGWEPLKTERKKAKAKMMYKVLVKYIKWVLNHSLIFFHTNVRKQTTTFGTFQAVLVYQNRVLTT